MFRKIERLLCTKCDEPVYPCDNAHGVQECAVSYHHRDDRRADHPPVPTRVWIDV